MNLNFDAAPNQGQKSQAETRTKREVLVEEIANVERSLEAAKATYDRWAGNPRMADTILSAGRAIDNYESRLALLRKELEQEAA